VAGMVYPPPGGVSNDVAETVEVAWWE